MAGISALSEGLQLGKGFRCSDGSIIEPIDYIHLLFPNKGFSSIGDNICFEPRPFSFLPLRDHLPDGDNFFMPDDLVDSIACVILVTCLVTVLMIAMKWVWSKLDPHFAAVTPPHKQWYVVANICKAITLALLTFSSRVWIGCYRAIYLDQFINLGLKRCTMIYIAIDIAALYMVPKLPRSTILHHMATASLAIIDSSINLKLKGWDGLLGVAKMSLLYGIFSTPNFAVNAYLGLRVVYPNTKWGPLVTLSMCVYVLCCVMNWSMHGVWLVGVVWNWDISIYVLLYLLPISAMVHDDIVLIKWLWRKGSPLAGDGRKDRKN